MPTSLASCFCCKKSSSKAPQPERPLDKLPSKTKANLQPKQEEEYVPASVPYGTFFAYGYNGQLPLQNRGKYKTYFRVEQKSIPNGVKPVDPLASNSDDIKKASGEQYTCTFNAPGLKTVIQYEPDKHTDMFQFGRSAEHAVDFIVMDTVPGAEFISDSFATRSTISRFACRILVDRSPPHLISAYAAGFDAKKQIILGETVPQWRKEDNTCDGLTTNGVLIMHQKGDWGPGMLPGVWREVSVAGDVYGLRQTRSAKERGKKTSESNFLKDGTMVDLCGVVVLYRSPEGLEKAPTVEELIKKREDINAKRPQCPVGLMTIRFPSNQVNQQQIDVQSVPHIYIHCGHVHGYHSWGKLHSIHQSFDDDDRTCPICRESGPFIPLKFGVEPAFYVDNGPLTHAFCPCGHVTSEKTARFWSKVLLPYGKDEFRAACPFCAKPLEGEHGFVKMIYQTE
eukprot:gene15840-17436_t